MDGPVGTQSQTLRQSGALPLEEIAAACWGDDELVKDGPIGAYNMVVLSTFHMLREIEASCALAEH
eukprot:3109045-Amphidinium_carterae.1